MRLDGILNCVDAHAEGETSRVVIGGMPPVPGTTMFDKKLHLERHADELRQMLLFEPRGTVTLCADVVFPSAHPDADFGYVIMEATDYPPMSGTNTINTATVLLETGMIPMVEPVTVFSLEAPGGIIQIEAQCRDGKCVSVKFRNQPAFTTHLGVTVEVDELGPLTIDIAYGGAFFAFADATKVGVDIVPSNAAELCRLGQLVTRAAAAQFPVAHPDNGDINTVSFTTWYSPPRAGGDWRNTNIISPGRCDRSACGTGTSAWMSVLHARGDLAIGTDFVSESILDTRFIGRIEDIVSVGAYSAIVPSIVGRSWIYSTSQIGRHPTDPFPNGYVMADSFGTDRRFDTRRNADGAQR